MKNWKRFGDRWQYEHEGMPNLVGCDKNGWIDVNDLMPAIGKAGSSDRVQVSVDAIAGPWVSNDRLEDRGVRPSRAVHKGVIGWQPVPEPMRVAS